MLIICGTYQSANTSTPFTKIVINIALHFFKLDNL